MNTLTVSVKIDRKVALLAGRVLADRESVEVTPGGDLWEEFVGILNMITKPPQLPDDFQIAEASSQAIFAEIRKRKEAQDRKQAEKASADQARFDEYKSAVETLLNAEYPITSKVLAVDQAKLAWYDRSPVGPEFSFQGFTCPEVPYPSRPWLTEMYKAEIEELSEKRDAFRKNLLASVKEMNELAYAEALPRLQLEKEKRDVEQAEKEAVEKARKAKAAAEKFAHRLETGVWERETDSYNERRYSAPWCANVSWKGVKPIYAFGDSTGRGSAGILSLRCSPGDFIAFGQKDLRNPRKSEHTIQRMRENGSMESFSNVAEAYKASK